jgi:phosphoserine phosphatase RsbU/P
MGRGSGGWFALAVTLLAAVAVVDVLDDTGSLLGACAVAPFIAGATCSTRRTVVVSVLTLAVGLGLLGAQGDVEALTAGVRLTVLGLAAVLAPFVAYARERGARRMRDLAHVAETAQLAVLTPVPPRVGPTRLSSAYQSASREAMIGGDLYGVVQTEAGVRLMIGDVRGKGIDAVRMAAVTLAAFREGTQRKGSTLARLARYCDEQLSVHLEDEDFVTALFADVSHDGLVELVSCGHPPPLLTRGDDVSTVHIEQPATPLGLGLQHELAPGLQRVPLQTGDRMLFYTDGLVEARDRRGRFLPLRTLVHDVGRRDFDEVLATVLARLHGAANEVRDDLAMLLVEYAGPGVAGGADGGLRLPEQATGEEPRFRRELPSAFLASPTA